MYQAGWCFALPFLCGTPQTNGVIRKCIIHLWGNVLFTPRESPPAKPRLSVPNDLPAQGTQHFPGLASESRPPDAELICVGKKAYFRRTTQMGRDVHPPPFLVP
jgi:hypothetical protein